MNLSDTRAPALRLGSYQLTGYFHKLSFNLDTLADLSDNLDTSCPTSLSTGYLVRQLEEIKLTDELINISGKTEDSI